MVSDDAQACLLAYRFAELLLGGFAAKPENERHEALTAAVKLRDDVEQKYETALTSPSYKSELVANLRATREQLEQKLRAAEAKTQALPLR